MADALFRLAEGVSHAFAAVTCLRHRDRNVGAVKRQETRLLSVFLLSTLAIDGLREIIQRAILHFEHVPYAGGYRVAFHLDQALFLAWPFGLDALAIGLSLRGNAKPLLSFLAVTYGFVFAGIVVSYPAIRGADLGVVYAMINAYCLLASVTTFALFVVSGATITATRRAVWSLLVADVVTMVGPYLLSPYRYWWIANVASTAAYALIGWWHLQGSRHPPTDATRWRSLRQQHVAYVNNTFPKPTISSSPSPTSPTPFHR